MVVVGNFYFSFIFPIFQTLRANVEAPLNNKIIDMQTDVSFNTSSLP